MTCLQYQYGTGWHQFARPSASPAERRPRGTMGGFSVRELAVGVRIRRRGRDRYRSRRLPLSRQRGGREMEMHDPAHPGDIVREECLKPLGLAVTAAAQALGI